jgi:hypothetical protein
MANLHPVFPLQISHTGGAQCERAILELLQQGLPPGFDLFHNIAWSVVAEGAQQIGEVDIVVVAPSGHILLLEIKAGDVVETPQKLLKKYGSTVKDIGLQVRRQHSSLLKRIQQGDLPQVHIESLLVLPDHRIAGESVAYPRQRIVDATDMGMLCSHVMKSFPVDHVPALDRQRVIDFLSNQFKLVPDVAVQIGQVQQANAQLASGMAQWVPSVQHAQGAYVIEATAGSGKTQLALVLLQRAAREKLKARYLCFNRPLADRLTEVAPSAVDVTTFHQLCRDHADRAGLSLDFGDPAVFTQMEQRYLQDAQQQNPTLDLLLIDESQDLQPEWVQAIMGGLKPDGRLYVMGDAEQQLYEREGFNLPDAVHIQCMDNFRSPRQVVRTINALGLTAQAIEPRSAYEGDVPGFHVYGAGQGEHLQVLNRCLKQLWSEGYSPEQVAVLSYNGVKNAEVLTQTELGGQATHRYSGQYDKAGNPNWSEGCLLVDSLYRFKGQSMPAVVLCEVNFETLSTKDRRKLFVGLTRAQLRVEVVLSARAAGIVRGLL